VEEMNEVMINNWNSVVGDKDDVYNLGDIFFTSDMTKQTEVLNRLNGKHHFIIGNHDKRNRIERIFNKFASVNHELCVQHGYSWFLLSHCPYLEWAGMEAGHINVYGHTHENMEKQIEPSLSIRQINVGVDAWDFTPVSADTILHTLSKRRAHLKRMTPEMQRQEYYER